MPNATRNRELVRFAGGTLDGLTVSCPAALADRLPTMRLTVTPGGKLYDRDTRQYVHGATIVDRP